MVENNYIRDPLNEEQKKAFELVKDTNSSLFITGKAGTGKTTFIKRIQQEIKKNFLVVAPTGIAALKVEGQTIHSVFRFPFGLITPETRLWGDFKDKPQLYQKSIALLALVDTIIVDEVSMVRCDLVDAMDRILRRVMSTNQPFGGKQVIFVGDLCQLPPVARQDDMEILSSYYGGGTPFFYKAHVLKRVNLPKIEFTKVYRQTDGEFIELLIKLCPECLNAYATMRREAMKDGKVIEDDGHLYKAFNNTSISDEEFVQALVQADKRELTGLRRKVNELWKKTSN